MFFTDDILAHYNSVHVVKRIVSGKNFMILLEIYALVSTKITIKSIVPKLSLDGMIFYFI